MSHDVKQFLFYVLILVYFKCDFCVGNDTEEDSSSSENVFVVKYLFYNQLKINDPDIVLTTMNSSFPNFDNDLPTKIIIHGFNSGCFEQFAVSNKDAFLKYMNVNVICVDWTSLSNSGIFNSIQGIYTTKDDLTVLIENLRPNMKKLHIIGHSFGAHIGGLTSRKLMRSGFEKIGRITGLDPASIFLGMDNTTRLDKSCADLVEIIHTSSIGTQYPIGHFDFYPNGGIIQPGCNAYIGCSHSRSHALYAESVLNPYAFPTFHCANKEALISRSCESYNEIFMGNEESYNRNRFSKEGIYYVNTKSEQPFSPLKILNDTTLVGESTLGHANKFLRLHAFGLHLWIQTIFYE